MTLTTVIFDIGNVIVRWEPHLALADYFDTADDAERYLRSAGFFDWNLEQDRGRSFADARTAARTDHAEHADVFEAYLDGIADAHANLVPGTSEIIERLDGKGLTLLALTNASVEAYEAVRDHVPAMGRMKDTLVSAREGVIKPDAEIFDQMVRRNGLTHAECLFIDDSPKNVDGARNAGLDAHHFIDAPTLEAALIERGLL